MRQFALAMGTVCAVAGFASTAHAQVNSMPGQVISPTINYSPGAIGREIPRVGKPAGQPLNMPADTPLLRRYDPNRPYDVFKGTDLDPNQVVAPIVGIGDQSKISKLYDKLASIVGFARPGQYRAPNYTPGIVRRAHERVDQRLWRRD
ncbi:MAG TPA: hypothetical protein VLM40_10520 [Gemmata sp.]|nr:hypothetical protein [Gemmata sp.]